MEKKNEKKFYIILDIPVFAKFSSSKKTFCPFTFPSWTKKKKTHTDQEQE